MVKNVFSVPVKLTVTMGRLTASIGRQLKLLYATISTIHDEEVPLAIEG